MLQVIEMLPDYVIQYRITQLDYLEFLFDFVVDPSVDKAAIEAEVVRFLQDDILHKTEEKVLLKYNDTLHLFPTYLPALGADFDGDTVTVQGIFGKYDVNKYVHSNMNIINIAGGSMRNISDVNSQVVYALTRTLKDV